MKPVCAYSGHRQIGVVCTERVCTMWDVQSTMLEESWSSRQLVGVQNLRYHFTEYTCILRDALFEKIDARTRHVSLASCDLQIFPATALFVWR